MQSSGPDLEGSILETTPYWGNFSRTKWLGIFDGFINFVIFQN